MKNIKSYFFNWTATATLAIVLSGSFLSSCTPSGGDQQDTSALTFLLAFLYIDSQSSGGVKVEGSADSNVMLQFRKESGDVSKSVFTGPTGEFSVSLSTGTYHVRTIDVYGSVDDETLIVTSKGVIEPDAPTSTDYKKYAYLLYSSKDTYDDVVNSESVYTYNDDGNLTERKRYSGEGGSATEDNLSSTVTLTYDDEGKQLTSTYDYPDSDVDDSLSVITYDDNDRVLAYTSYSGGTTTTTATISSYTVNTWEEGGNLIASSYTDSTYPEFSSYTEYTYDDNDMVTEIKNYDGGSDSSTAELYSTITMTYTDDGYIATYTRAYESNPENDYVRVFQYDSDMNLTMYSSYSGDTEVDSATLSSTRTFTYDENANIDTVLYQYYEADGVTVDSSTFRQYAYNADNYETQYDYYTGEDATGTHGSFDTNTYDENNFLTEERSYDSPYSLVSDYSSNIYTVDTDGNRLTETYANSTDTADDVHTITSYTWMAR